MNGGMAGRTVGFYYHGSLSVDPLDLFSRRLAQHGCTIRTFCAPELFEPHQHLMEIRGGEPVAPENMGEVEGLDLLISYDTPLTAPYQVPAIALPHALVSGGLENESPNQYAFYCPQTRHFDYLFLPYANLLKLGPKMAQVFSGLYPSGMLKRPSRHFTIVPSGYLKLDLLIKDCGGQERRDAIIYAPGTLKSSKVCGNVLLDGAGIIETLLEHFSGYKLIFRPFPGEAGLPEIRELVGRYVDHPSFILDTEPSSLSAMARAATVVTDRSKVVESYSLSTLRAHVRCKLGERDQGKEMASLPMGFEVYTKTQLIQAVSRCLQDGPLRQQILDMRDQLLLNVGRAAEAMVEHVEYILDGKEHPDWVVVDRSPARDSARDVKGAFPYKALFERNFNAWRDLMRHETKDNLLEAERVENLSDFVVNYLSCLALTYEPAPMFRVLGPEEEKRVLGGTASGQIMIWGMGGRFKDFFAFLPGRYRERFLGFIDGEAGKAKTKFEGYRVYAPDALPILQPDILVVAAGAKVSILMQAMAALDIH